MILRLSVKRCWSLSLATSLLALGACGKKDKNDDEDEASETGSVSGIGTSIAVANSLALAVPTSLSLAALPQGGGASLALQEDTEVNSAKETPEVERARDRALLKGEGNCLSLAAGGKFKEIIAETCYEFDRDMIYAKGEQGTLARTGGTKNGKNAAGEACLVAFARGKVARVKQEVDQARGMLNMALCQAKKDLGTPSLPAAIGDKIDLKVHADAALAVLKKKPTIEDFTMTYISDVDGRPVFETTFKATDGLGHTRQFAIRHRAETDGEQYSGSLRLTVTPPAGGKGVFGDEKKNFISIGYARNLKGADYENAYELRIASFGTDWQAYAIDDNGVVNFNPNIVTDTASPNFGAFKKPDGSVEMNTNAAVSGLMYITFSENETTRAQRIAYWQNPGGNYYENARGMVFEATPGADNLYTGCAESGAASIDMGKGISIRRSLYEATADVSLAPRGFYHPFLNTQQSGGGGGCSPTLDTNAAGEYKYVKENCPGQPQNLKFSWAPLTTASADATAFVEKQNDAIFSKQCFKQNAAGLYEIDTAKTTSVDGYDLVRTASVVPPTVADARKFDPSKAKGQAPK